METSRDVEHEPEEMYTVYHVTSPDDLAFDRAREDGATQERQSPVTVRASPGRSLAERQLDRPRPFSSRWVSVPAKVSSSDYCEETMKLLLGAHRTSTRGQEARRIEVFRQMPR